MDFLILGPLEVLDEGRVVQLGGTRQRVLLTLLLLHADEALSMDQLIDELWGERPPATADKMVHVQISRLRKSLALWRGAALADVAYEPFAQPEIKRLHELRITALEQQVEADLVLGRHSGVVGRLPGLIADHPYRERLHAQLMLALYRCERQGGSDPARAIAALLAEESARAIETFWAVRRLFEMPASRQPLVVVIEDAHWRSPRPTTTSTPSSSSSWSSRSPTSIQRRYPRAIPPA